MLQRFKKSLLVFFFTCLGILYPFISLAGWVQDLKKGIGVYILFIIVKLYVNIAKFFTGLAGSLLNWVLGPNFISLSYTDPENNPIIEAGLNVTRGFVNMLLVLVLVYIAIATILRLAGYETKKLLITFIIVALLVNFAPVICGLIVDASNIVMNFFVQDLKADAFGTAMARSVEEISAGFTERTELEGGWDQITQLAVMVPFLWVLTFILLLFTLIFIARYVVIWLLVILAPLAFACYILPITKKYWETWWEQFMAWSFIGTTCGFFLYLGLLLATNIQAGTAVTAPTTGKGTGLFDSILPYFVSAVFLGIGFVFGLQTSAKGATTVINFAKARGRGTLRGAAKGAGWVAGKGASRIKEHIEDKLKTKELAHGLTKTWEKHPTVRWLLPERLRKYGQMRPAVEADMKELEYLSSRDIGRMMANKTLFGRKATAGLLVQLNRGDTQDAMQGFREKYKAETGIELTDKEIFQKEDFKKEMGRGVQISFESGYQSKLLRGDPRLARLAAGKKWAFGYENLNEDNAVRKATGEARAKSIDNWEREVLEDEVVAETLLSKGRDIPEAIVRLVKRGQETLLKTFDENFTEWVDKTLIKETPDIAKGVQRGDKSSTTLAMKRYQDFIKNKYGASGYFDYAKGVRAKELGWREVRYVPPGPTPGPTPGEATGMGAAPPSPSDTGEVRKKKKRAPDVGEE